MSEEGTQSADGYLGREHVFTRENVRAAVEIADRAYVLENGRVTLSGSGASGTVTLIIPFDVELVSNCNAGDEVELCDCS